MLKQISSLFGIKFRPPAFFIPAVSHSPVPQIGSDLLWPKILVTGKEFSKYIWLWTATIPDKTLIEQRTCIAKVKAYNDTLHKVVNAWLEQDCVPITSALDRILLSIVLLGESLAYKISHIFGTVIEDETFKTRYRQSRSRYLCDQLIRVDWCEGELPLLFERRQPPVLLYLSSIETRGRTRVIQTVMMSRVVC